MSMLDGFETFDFDVGVASASITPNGITFNKAVIIKMGYPSHALLLLNKEKKQMAIVSCKEGTPKAVSFYKEPKNVTPVRSVRWNNRDLLNTISELMDWDLNNLSHRVIGKLVPEENAMLFDLSASVDMR